jgi:ribonuclease P protein subunit POP4
MRNVKNLLLHELIGLDCTVMKAENKSQAGIAGKITDETMKTLVVGGKRVFKKGTVFRVTINGKKADIDGNYLIARPEDRIKKKVRKW